ncbi:MAG TPA: diguanylate cyclase [Actinotalea sp.]|nr:diguanylate cyclase [Actinotalea sp.]
MGAMRRWVREARCVVHDGMYAELLDSMSDGVYFVDRERRITYWNSGAGALSGYSRDEVVGRRCRDGLLNHVDEAGAQLCGARCPLLWTMRDGQPRECHILMHHKDGHLVPVRVRASPLRDPAGTIVGAVEVFSDDTALRTARLEIDQLQSLAQIDPLTALGNRRYLDRCLDQRLGEWSRYGIPFGVLIADIDRFKSVNDTFGHDVGDEVLRVIAATLTHGLRAGDGVARMGGEEFAVVTGHIGPSELAGLAERIRMLVSRSRYAGPAGPLSISVSIGGAMIRPGEDAHAVLRRADQRLLAAKETGRDRVVTTDEARRAVTNPAGSRSR